MPAPAPHPGPASFPDAVRRGFRTHELRDLPAIAAREAARVRIAGRLDAGLARAARTGERIIVGPFLGEVGFELLYWIPFLRGALARHGIPRERITTLTRGGAGPAWYGDLAGSHIEVLELLDADTFQARLAERRRATGDTKLLTVERLDLELAAAARAQTGDAFLFHPAAMYARLRPVWAGWRGVGALGRLLSFAPLVPGTASAAVQAAVASLPASFVAVKAYFGDCLPDTAENREALSELVAALATRIDVVVLRTGRALDGHEEWSPAAGDRIHLLEPPALPENLAVQTAVVARARGLVAPYGGFAYLGAFLGMPTVALRAHEADEADNPVHLAVLRLAATPAPFSCVAPGRASVDGFPSVLSS